MHMNLKSTAYVSTVKKIKSIEYEIQSYLENDSLLSVEIYNSISGDEWQAQYSQEYIEELTRKTGSFKSFSTFFAMLQTSLLENIPTLHLDILSFSELESLRRTKFNIKEAQTIPKSREKLYLILSYMTEFDKIRYPLPLNSVGVISTAVLRKIIKNLRTEVHKLKVPRMLDEFVKEENCMHLPEVTKLKEENQKLLNELAELHRQLHVANKVVTQNGDSMQPNLRAFVDTLENELFEEKTKSARQAGQHRYELQQVRAELDASMACQRNLRRRIDQLTNELAVLKRGKEPRTHSSERCHQNSHRFSRRDGTPSSPIFPQTQLSRRTTSPLSVRTSLRAGSLSPGYYRPSASPVCQTHRYMLASASTHSQLPPRAYSASSVATHFRRPSSSPVRRFNPTEYVKEMKQRREEIALRRRAERQRQLSDSSNDRGRTVPNRNSWQAPDVFARLTSPIRGCFRSRISSTSALYSSCESLAPVTSSSRFKPGNRKPRCATRSSGNVRGTRDLELYGVDHPEHNIRSRILQLLSSDDESTAPRVRKQPRHVKQPSVTETVPVNEFGDTFRPVHRSRSTDRGRLPDRDLDSNHSSSPVLVRSAKQHQKCGSQREVSPERNSELDEIDRRLTVLQSFFHKYLGDT